MWFNDDGQPAHTRLCPRSGCGREVYASPVPLRDTCTAHDFVDTGCGSVRSRLQFEVARPPALVEPRFQRPIEPQKDAVTLAGHGLHPVPFVASRCAGREPDRHSTVLVRLDARDRPVDSRQLLVGRKERTVWLSYAVKAQKFFAGIGPGRVTL